MSSTKTGGKRGKKSQAEAREELLASARPKEVPDPLSPANLRSMGLRLGIPFVGIWVVAILWNRWYSYVGALVLSIAIGVFVGWALRMAKRSRTVADIVRGADTAEARKEALGKLESFKKDDAAAAFAKAQIQMQEDPRQALATLEEIKLDKVMAPIADQARAQRAMIHLMLGEIEPARQLADAIDLSRHKEAKERATLSAIVGEALARTGQAKKAVEMLETIDVDDAAYADVAPQLLRSRAFAYANANDTKKMKNTLRKLKGINVQYLSGFVTKRKVPGGVAPRGVHPLLEKEALDMITKSGAVQRKVEFRRG